MENGASLSKVGTKSSNGIGGKGVYYDYFIGEQLGVMKEANGIDKPLEDYDNGDDMPYVYLIYDTNGDNDVC